MLFNFKNELSKMTPLIAQGSSVYIFGASPVWDHIRLQYKYLVNIEINDHIDGFIDNDHTKQGTVFHGKPVKALTEVDLESTVIIIASYRSKSNLDIGLQLNNAGMIFTHSFFMVGCFMTLLMRYEYERFIPFRDKHKGQRCFIIGNGPSLQINDLEKLKDEISFATNKIFLMFEKTSWRPSYYAIHEDVLLRTDHENIKSKINCPIFYAYNSVFEIDNFSLTDEYYYYLENSVDWKPGTISKPTFSEEAYVIQWGATITYDCLQLAAYMGFSEIYLLGVDHSFPMTIKNNGEIISKDVEGHFTKSYGGNLHYARTDISEAAYQVAENYANKNGIKIYNATRGGELEIFDRIDFDKLF